MQWHERARAKREELGLSQAKLAKQAGVTQGLINKIEQGQVKSTRHWKEISRALGLKYEDVFELAEDELIRTEGKLDEYHGEHHGKMSLFQAREEAGSLGSGLILVFSYGREQISRPPQLEGVRNPWAMTVSTATMAPEVDYGDILYIHPFLPPVPGTTVFLARIPSKEERGDAMFPTIFVGQVVRLHEITVEDWVFEIWNPGDGGARVRRLPRSEWPVVERVVVKDYRR